MTPDRRHRSDPVTKTEVEDAVARTLADPFLGHDTATATLTIALDQHCEKDQSLTTGVHELLHWFDEAARPLFGAGSGDLHEQAAVINRTIVDHLPGVADTRDPTALLLRPALARGSAHPLLLAIISHELARRAGLHSIVAYGQDRWWTVLTRDGSCLPIGYTPPPTDGLAAEQLRARCAHETAYRTLIAIQGHAHPALAASAARICDRLPLADCTPARPGPPRASRPPDHSTGQ